MVPAWVYGLIAVAALVAILGLLFFTGGAAVHRRLSPLIAVALLLVVVGTAFGSDQSVGYVLIGIGVAIAVVDVMVRRGRPTASGRDS